MPKKILFVDDEPDARQLVTDVLKMEGYSVDTAVDGSDCLKKAEKTKYDLILLDIMMPGLTPKEIIKGIHVSKNNKDTKIAYLSVVDFPSEEKEGLLKQKNVVDYLQKPFDNERLISRIKNLVK